MNLINIFLKNYSELTPSHKKIANYIVENSEEFLSQSALEIGKASHTSSATVIRFAKRFGFSSLEDLKINIAKNIKEVKKSEKLNPIFTKGDTIEDVGNKLLDSVSVAIKTTMNNLDYDNILLAVDWILKADTVFLHGIGASGNVAYDLYHKLNRSNIRATYNFDTHMALEFSYHTKKNDVLIAISYGGNTKEVIYPTEQGKKNGAKIIVISRPEPSPLTKLADIHLVVPNLESLVRIGAISSKFSTMILADMIFMGIIRSQFDIIEKDFLGTSHLVQKLKY